jgi:hypothetical protein
MLHHTTPILSNDPYSGINSLKRKENKELTEMEVQNSAIENTEDVQLMLMLLNTAFWIVKPCSSGLFVAAPARFLLRLSFHLENEVLGLTTKSAFLTKYTASHPRWLYIHRCENLGNNIVERNIYRQTS